MKHLYSLFTVLIFVNMLIAAEGKQETPPSEKTPIKSSQVKEETLTGILMVQDGVLILVDDTGIIYAISPRPMSRDSPMGGGPPPGGQTRMKPGGKTQKSGMGNPTPDMSKQFEKYNGQQAVIQGMVMKASPENSLFGDAEGVIFPQSILVEGEDILIYN